MVLVSYSDSDSNSNSDSETQRPINNSTQALSTKSQSRKRKANSTLPSSTASKPRTVAPGRPPNSPPPLPSAFHTLYTTNIRTGTSDDPTLHGGRKRQIEHVKGNWPSHVSLEWVPNNTQLSKLDELISTAQDIMSARSRGDSTGNQKDIALNSFLRSSLGAQLPLHISLSAPLVLSTVTKDSFRDRLKEAIIMAKIGTVVVKPASLDLVPNFEKSRWFLVLRLKKEGSQRMSRLLEICNRVCGEFELPLLYRRGENVGVDLTGNVSENSIAHEEKELVTDVNSKSDPSEAFHVSIAWTLSEVSQGAVEAIRHMKLGECGEDEIKFEEVKIKIGNVVDSVEL